MFLLLPLRESSSSENSSPRLHCLFFFFLIRPFNCRLRPLLLRRCCGFFLAIAASSSPVFKVSESSSSCGACSSLLLDIVYCVLFCVLVCIGVACFVFCVLLCSVLCSMKILKNSAPCIVMCIVLCSLPFFSAPWKFCEKPTIYMSHTDCQFVWVFFFKKIIFLLVKSH